MERLWLYVDGLNLKAITKYRIVLTVSALTASLAGFMLWMLIRMWGLSEISWMICFTAYPFVITWGIMFLWLCRHEFHDGRYCQPRR